MNKEYISCSNSATESESDWIGEFQFSQLICEVICVFHVHCNIVAVLCVVPS